MSTTAIGAPMVQPEEAQAHRVRWGVLASGIVWMLVSLAILVLDERSVRIVGVIIGCVLLLAAGTQAAEMFISTSWRWVHAAVGLVTIVLASAAFTSPFQTVGALSLLVGVALTVRGATGTIACLVHRDRLVWWGVTLALALSELVIGVWALSHPERSLALLLLWVGAAAMFRGRRSAPAGSGWGVRGVGGVRRSAVRTRRLRRRDPRAGGPRSRTSTAPPGPTATAPRSTWRWGRRFRPARS